MQEKEPISVEQLIKEAAISCGRDPATITLVAVSKGHDANDVEELYKNGQRIFGESRVQEADEKRSFLPPDIEWHLIGTLQAKKVNKVIGKYALIHSVHRVELALKLSQASQAKGIVTNILLQVNPLGEETKHGFSIQELYDVFPVLLTQPGIKLKGLMAMAPNTDDKALIKKMLQQNPRGLPNPPAQIRPPALLRALHGHVPRLRHSNHLRRHPSSHWFPLME